MVDEVIVRASQVDHLHFGHGGITFFSSISITVSVSVKGIDCIWRVADSYEKMEKVKDLS